jgi:hypothetical protein
VLPTTTSPTLIEPLANRTVFTLACGRFSTCLMARPAPRVPISAQTLSRDLEQLLPIALRVDLDDHNEEAEQNEAIAEQFAASSTSSHQMMKSESAAEDVSDEYSGNGVSKKSAAIGLSLDEDELFSSPAAAMNKDPLSSLSTDTFKSDSSEMIQKYGKPDTELLFFETFPSAPSASSSVRRLRRVFVHSFILRARMPYLHELLQRVKAPATSVSSPSSSASVSNWTSDIDTARAEEVLMMNFVDHGLLPSDGYQALFVPPDVPSPPSSSSSTPLLQQSPELDTRAPAFESSIR